MRNRLRGRAEIWEQSGVNYGGGDAFFGVIRLGYMWGGNVANLFRPSQ